MKIGSANIIADDVIIGDNVTIGNGNIIKSGTKIYDNVIIGDNNVFLENNIIGSLAALSDVDYKDTIFGGVIIGDNNYFHISNIISSGYYQKTIIGDNNKLLSKVYISHDCKIGNNITFYPNAFSAGIVTFNDYCNIGAGAHIHQKTRIGSYAMIGMNCNITKNVLPFLVTIGLKYTRPNIKILPKELLDNIDILNSIVMKSNKKESIQGDIDKLPPLYRNYFKLL